MSEDVHVPGQLDLLDELNSARPSMCPRCRDEWVRWLDTRPSQFNRGIPMGFSTNRDASAEGVAENRHARWERWRDLVREQQHRISDGCARGVHA